MKLFNAILTIAVCLACVQQTRAVDTAPVFRRGDHDGSGMADINDAIDLLRFLFLNTNPPIYLNASDVENSGAIDITDPIMLLGFLFFSSLPLQDFLPGPRDCGPDPTEEIDPDDPGGFPPQPAMSLGCEMYPADGGIPCE